MFSTLVRRIAATDESWFYIINCAENAVKINWSRIEIYSSLINLGNWIIKWNYVAVFQMYLFSIDTQSSLALLCLLFGLGNQNPKLITLFSLQNKDEN